MMNNIMNNESLLSPRALYLKHYGQEHTNKSGWSRDQCSLYDEPHDGLDSPRLRMEDEQATGSLQTREETTLYKVRTIRPYSLRPPGSSYARHLRLRPETRLEEYSRVAGGIK